MDPDKLANAQKMELEKEPGLTIAPCQLRPESRGRIRIKSPDPAAYPAIQPNYLADRLDQEVAVAGLRWGRRIAERPALARYIERELMPGPDVVTDEPPGKKPVIATHSNCRAIANVARNLDDDMIRALAKTGGVCCVVGR